jgi:hypothetical protein
MNQGWECPRCHQCYAPTVKKCKACKPVAAAPIYWPDWTYRPWPWYPSPYWSSPYGGGGVITLCADSTSADSVTISSSAG